MKDILSLTLVKSAKFLKTLQVVLALTLIICLPRVIPCTSRVPVVHSIKFSYFSWWKCEYIFLVMYTLMTTIETNVEVNLSKTCGLYGGSRCKSKFLKENILLIFLNDFLACFLSFHITNSKS